MLDAFQSAQQVISVFTSTEGKPLAKTAYSRFGGITKEYFDKHSLFELIE